MTWAARIPTLAGLRYPQASFVLDFASNYYRGSGAQGSSPSALPGYNFTRALAAYGEDAAGNLILFPSGAPRITNKGVLIEEGRTNMLLRSGDITNATWVTANGAIKSNSGATPPGLGVATLIDFSTATPFPLVVQYATGTAATAYKWSIWLWATGSDIGKTISLDGEYVSEPANGRVSITLTSVPTRYSITITPTTTILAPRIIKYNSGGSQDTANSAIAWGAQLEAGSFPTSYIPTTSASVTRPADVFYYSGAAVASSFTLAATIEHSFANSGAGYYPVVSIGGSFSNIAAIVRRDISNAYQGLVRSSSATVADMLGGGAPQSGVHALALRVADNQFALAKDGAIISTDTVGTSPALNGDRLAIGTESWSPGSQGVAGYVPRIALFPFAASDAQLQSISSGNF